MSTSPQKSPLETTVDSVTDRYSRRLNNEIDILSYLVENTVLGVEEKKYAVALKEQLEKNAISASVEENKKGLSIKDWVVVQKLLLKVRNSETEHDTKTLLYRLHEGILQKRQLDLPEEAVKSKLTEMLQKSGNSYLTAYAADIFDVAKKSGIYKDGDQPHNERVNNEIIFVDTFERKFETSLQDLEKNKITVGQIADLETIKDSKQRVRAFLSLTSSGDKEVKNYSFDTDGIELQQQVLISGLLVEIYKRALGDGTLKQLILQKALRSNASQEEIKLIKGDEDYYARETTIGEAMEVMLTAHSGDKSHKVLIGIIESAKKYFGKDASIPDRIRGIVTYISNSSLDNNLETDGEEAILAYLTENYGDRKDIDIQKMAKAFFYISPKEIDTEENAFWEMLQKQNINLNSAEKALIKQLLSAKELLDDTGKPTIKNWISSMLTNTPETASSPNILSQIFKSTKDIDPIRNSFLSVWTERASIEDVMMFDELKVLYDSAKATEKDSVELMILGVLAVWMKKNNVQGADDIGFKVGEAMTKEVLRKIGGMISKVDIATLDITDRTQSSLYYAMADNHVDPSIGGNMKTLGSQIGKIGGQIKDFIGPWWMILPMYIGAVNIFSYGAFKNYSRTGKTGAITMSRWLTKPLLLGRFMNPTLATMNQKYGTGVWKMPDQEVLIEKAKRENDTKTQAQIKEEIKQDIRAETALEGLPDKLTKLSSITDALDPDKTSLATEIEQDIQVAKSHSDYTGDVDFKKRVDTIAALADPVEIAKKGTDISIKIADVKAKIDAHVNATKVRK